MKYFGGNGKIRVEAPLFLLLYLQQRAGNNLAIK